DIAYAYYLRALSYYEQITDVQRDQAVTEEAMASLRQVFSRFPDSKYARDAKLKFELTEDHLAGKEMSIGRYYQKRGQIQAAINRYRRVIDEFQTTSHVPEALHRLTESYLELGVVPEAQSAAAVLGHNFPGSDWYEDSYVLLADEGYEPVRPPEGGWWSRMMDNVAGVF
ncbi:MAG: outer membrane protein assembly factor BamD, partial [Pseudomonadota bacterium]